MSRTSLTSYSKLSGLEDERNILKEVIGTSRNLSGVVDMSSNVPGSVPEKIVYNYLFRLGVSFGYEYALPATDTGGVLTNYGISWVPSFYLPDYSDSGIKILISGQDEINSDLQMYLALNKYNVIRYGLNNTGGLKKLVFWEEQEVYRNLPALFNRDFPEILENRIKGNILQERRFISRTLQPNQALLKTQRTNIIYDSTLKTGRAKFDAPVLSNLTEDEKLMASRSKKAASKLVGKETEMPPTIKKLSRQLRKTNQDKFKRQIYGR